MTEPQNQESSPLVLRREQSEQLRIHSHVNSIYFGPNGLRAGWRLLVFFAVLSVSVLIVGLLRNLSPDRVPIGHIFEVFDPAHVMFGELVGFIGYLLASWVMALIEGRRIADYGLPARQTAWIRVCAGAAGGFAAISLLLVALRLTGTFHFGAIGLNGAAVWRYGIMWALAFLCVGLQEEFGARGYVLFTLTTGVGFWPAALLTSFLFGAVHLMNPGESVIGVTSAGMIGFFFCVLLRKTGDLWAPIGFHAAWDWGQTYFYGVPDSGLVAPGHLFGAEFAGPRWLTGGSAGPEASVFCLVLVVVLCVAVGVLFPDANYPNPAAIPDPRRPREVLPSAIPSS